MIEATKTNGGPAFPCPLPHSDSGMTLRDYFAAKAMQALLSNQAITRGQSGAEKAKRFNRRLAAAAYLTADSMLAARIADTCSAEIDDQIERAINSPEMDAVMAAKGVHRDRCH
jgi:hypothetical protein